MTDHGLDGQGVYLPMPIDREKLGEKRVEKIHRQIETLEKDMKERQALIDKLSKMQSAETKERERQDKFLEKYNQKNTLKNEMERLYGRDTTVMSLGGERMGKSNMIDSMIKTRTREHSLKQKEVSIETEFLVKERQRLQAARDRVREQRRNLLNAASPADSIRSEPDAIYKSARDVEDQSRLSLRSPDKVHNVDAYIKDTIDHLPQTIDRIQRLRRDQQRHYEKYKRPYRGEMGIHSYRPDQLKTYFMVRNILDDVVNSFMDSYISPVMAKVERETYFALMENAKKQRGLKLDHLSERKVVQLLMEEIVLDVTGDLIEEAGKEAYHSYGTAKNMIDPKFIGTAEAIALAQDEGRKPEDPLYDMITKTYNSLKKQRTDNKEEFWTHSQSIQIKEDAKILPPPRPPPPPQPPTKGKKKKKKDKQPEPEPLPTPVSIIPDKEDPDIVVLEYHPITPIDLKNYEPVKTDLPEARLEKQKYKRFMKREVEYWKDINTTIIEKIMPKSFNGLHCAVPSPNGRFLAVGSVHGDCLIYDTWMSPWRPVKVVVNDGSKDDTILNIIWSLDSSRLITINHSGVMYVWSFLGGGVQKSDIKKLGIPADIDGNYPHQLLLLISLEKEETKFDARSDFKFIDGPLADQSAIEGNYGPTSAAFYPSLSIGGIQNTVCVGIESGDILRCDLEFTLNAGENDQDYHDVPKILGSKSSNAEISTISKGVEADLLRSHRAPLIHIGFIDNINSMVSVDEQGYINLWRHSKSKRVPSGWYVPTKRFKLSDSKAMYNPSTSEKPKIIFTDKSQTEQGKRPKTRQEIAREREMATNTITNMMLGDPWHEEYTENKTMKTSVYVPKGGVKDSGSMFHIVIKHVKTDQLSSYLTRLYKPFRIKYTKMISVMQSADGNELIFVLLFPAYPPKGAHLSIIIFDLKSEQLREMRRDINLTKATYKLLEEKDVTHCAVSKVFGPTGTEYLFMAINGNLKAYSLTTGKQVIEAEDPSGRFSGFPGLIVDSTELNLPQNSKITILCSKGKIFALFYAEKVNRLVILVLEDNNPDVTRRAVWKAYECWEGHRVVPAELRVNPVTYYLTKPNHPTVAMRSIVLECVNKAIEQSSQETLTEEDRIKLEYRDKVVNYKAFEDLVRTGGILDEDSAD